jgi:hypothetical protein
MMVSSFLSSGDVDTVYLNMCRVVVRNLWKGGKREENEKERES